MQGPRGLRRRLGYTRDGSEKPDEKELYNHMWAFLNGYQDGWSYADVEKFGDILTKETTLLPGGLRSNDGGGAMYEYWMTTNMRDIEERLN